MVSIKDIEKLLEDFMLEPDVKFGELKPYLLSEFEWNVDPLNSQFMVRGLPIPNDSWVVRLHAAPRPARKLPGIKSMGWLLTPPRL